MHKLLCLSLLALSLLTANLSLVRANEYISVCSLSLTPQTMPDSDGNPQGYAVEILQAVANSLNWELHIQYYPWARVVSMSKKGNCDIVLTVLKRHDYQTYMVFPELSILDQKNIIVVRKNSGITFDGNIEAFMRKHSIGLYQDKAVNEQFEQLRNQPWAKIDVAHDSAQNLKKLLAKRFDAAIENDLTAIYELKKLGGLDEIEILSPPINVTPAYITFPLAGKLSNQMHEFDKAMAGFKTTDAFKVLSNKYLNVVPTESEFK